MLFCIGKVDALEANVELFDNLYWNVQGSDKLYSDRMGFITIDGRIVYCLDPFAVVGSQYNRYNFEPANITKDDLEYFKLIANYSEKSVQNKVKDYYLAAQELIWERLAGDDTVFWSNEKNGGGAEYDIESYKSTIRKKIDNFYMKPSFNETTLISDYKNVTRIEDTNHVLSNYEVYSEGSNNVWIEGNYLNIFLNDENLSEIKLIRKEGAGTTKFYANGENQDLMDLYSEVSIESNLYVKADDQYFQEVTINFKDENTLDLLTDEIKFSITNIDSGDTNYYSTNNGYFLVDLGIGNYKLSVINVPNGYLNFETIDFQIIRNPYFNYKRVDVFVDKAIGKLIVNNHTDAFFQLFSYGSFCYTPNLEDMNHFEVNLPLGKYYLLNINSNKRYDFDLIYKDAYTPIIYYYLDIYEELESEVNTNNQDSTNNVDKQDKNEELDKNIGQDNTFDNIKNEKDFDNLYELDKKPSNVIETLDNKESNSDIEYLPNTINYYNNIIVFICSLFLLSIIVPKHEK